MVVFYWGLGCGVFGGGEVVVYLFGGFWGGFFGWWVCFCLVWF